MIDLLDLIYKASYRRLKIYDAEYTGSHEKTAQNQLDIALCNGVAFKKQDS